MRSQQCAAVCATGQLRMPVVRRRPEARTRQAGHCTAIFACGSIALQSHAARRPVAAAKGTQIAATPEAPATAHVVEASIRAEHSEHACWCWDCTPVANLGGLQHGGDSTSSVDNEFDICSRSVLMAASPRRARSRSARELRTTASSRRYLAKVMHSFMSDGAWGLAQRPKTEAGVQA